MEVTMLEKLDKRDKIHLINLIGRRSNNTPNFALLIGAGASASSGVKTASEMIAEWRRQLYEESKSTKPFEEWLKDQDFYEDDEEYGILFEKLCDQRSQRRTYIEECVKDAKPSWGYIYLANIIAHNYFNVTFTPNFDDLLNEACCLYADLKPIVCAHDSAVVDIRITSARPKIIKLHGDFLYDSIKNTVRETETLEENMREKFKQFSREYGLVVIGYGGNDRSIIDILDTMLKSEGYFPNGLYWCIRKEGKVSKKLDRLMQRENTYYVEIESFDEFMAELHEKLGLTLPDTVRDPYKAITEKLNTFILPKEKVEHPIIKKDIAELEKQVKKFEQVVTGEISIKEFDRLVPYRFLGDTDYRNKNYRNALLYYEKALLQNPNDLEMMNYMVFSYIWSEDFDKALETSENMISQDPSNFRGYHSKGNLLIHLNRLEDALANYNQALSLTKRPEEIAEILTNRSNTLLIAGKWEEALSDAERALQIGTESKAVILNKCIALKKLDRKEEAAKIIQDILPKLKDKYFRAGAFAILSDKKNMLKELKMAIDEASGSRVKAKIDPDFADYREDPDFRKLVYGK
jgi:tetratricopeptide (TPR) repeat protein/NAD-dependent SIR2 family protein deacetylase